MQIDWHVFNKKLLKLSLPIVFQSLMLALVAAADALMLGRVAQEEMTAVSLATQVQFVQNMVFFAIMSASSILGAQYFGKGDTAMIRDIFNVTLTVAFGVSILCFLGCELIPDKLMRIFTTEQSLIEIGSGYLKIAGWSYLLTGLSQSCLTVMKFTDHVRPSALISSTAVVLNIVLNSVFIFGLFGIAPMRAEGAAIATLIARIAEFLLCAAVMTRKSFLKPAWKRFFKVPGVLYKDYFRQELPLMGGVVSWGVGFTTFTAIIGHLGPDAAAANSVAAVIRDLVCCMCDGVGGAAAIIVGNELGQGKLSVGKAYGIRLKNFSFVIGFLSSAIILAVTPLVVRSVLLSDEARSYLTGMMLILSVYIIGHCVNTVIINGVLDGGGDTLFDMYSLLVMLWGFAIPAAFLSAFVFHMPVLVVYACSCLDEVGKIPWTILRFRKYKWVKDLTR